MRKELDYLNLKTSFSSLFRNWVDYKGLIQGKYDTFNFRLNLVNQESKFYFCGNFSFCCTTSSPSGSFNIALLHCLTLSQLLQLKIDIYYNWLNKLILKKCDFQNNFMYLWFLNDLLVQTLIYKITWIISCDNF